MHTVKIVVTGDVIADRHLYQGERPRPDAAQEVGSSSSLKAATMAWNWTVAGATLSQDGSANRPLFGLAHGVALKGYRTFRYLPYAKFGSLYSADRQEIESLRAVRNLICAYNEGDKGDKPLSIAVFGPPGAGKSFAIKQIAQVILTNAKILEFNLAQFGSSRDLIGLFHQVRDQVLKGFLPLVFWDEFDSRKLEWLQYFLAPMQDGQFQEGQITHPIGKSIFIFAGGTSASMAQFAVQRGMAEFGPFREMKGPDFVSRLSGYLDVRGPNQRLEVDESGSETADPLDISYPIRRALLLRSMLGLKDDQELDIDRGLLTALLQVSRYVHGARSMEKIVQQLKANGGTKPRRSHLPSSAVLTLHVDSDEFHHIIMRYQQFKLNDNELARHYHRFYAEHVTRTGEAAPYNLPFDELPDEMKADNRAAARRIPEVLELVGLFVIPLEGSVDPDHEIETILERHLEILAEAEHDGWMAFRIQNGWQLGKRNDHEKRHPCLIPYAQLAERDKDKDRNAVRAYPAILRLAGYRPVTRMPQ